MKDDPIPISAQVWGSGTAVTEVPDPNEKALMLIVPAELDAPQP